MAQQKTYTMIKPDGVRNGHIGEIVNRFERAGLKIERMELGRRRPTTPSMRASRSTTASFPTSPAARS